jgi:myosin heavy subunit
LELNLYKAEDIKVDDVKFTDNQLCLDLIERPIHGVLAVLDEELKLPKGGDDNFLTRLMKSNEPKSGMKHFIPTKKRVTMRRACSVL